MKQKLTAAGNACALACTFLLPLTAPVAADDLYQLDALLDPSPALLEAERRGRVTIFHGLDNNRVEQALDSQFHRIENLMFVNTRYPLPDDETYAEDDCD